MVIPVSRRKRWDDQLSDSFKSANFTLCNTPHGESCPLGEGWRIENSDKHSQTQTNSLVLLLDQILMTNGHPLTQKKMSNWPMYSHCCCCCLISLKMERWCSSAAVVVIYLQASVNTVHPSWCSHTKHTKHNADWRQRRRNEVLMLVQMNCSYTGRQADTFLLIDAPDDHRLMLMLLTCWWATQTLTHTSATVTNN